MVSHCLRDKPILLIPVCKTLGAVAPYPSVMPPLTNCVHPCLLYVCSLSLSTTSQIYQVLSDAISFVLPVLFACKALTSAFCLASSFASFLPQLKCHLFREFFLTSVDITAMITLYCIPLCDISHDLHLACLFLVYNLS